MINIYVFLFFSFQRRPEIEYHRNPAGDNGKFTSRKVPCEAQCTTEHKTTQFADCQRVKYQTDKITQSCDALFCNSAIYNKNYTKEVTSYHCFCLNISLAAIALVSDKLPERQIEFRFVYSLNALLRSTILSKSNASLCKMSNFYIDSTIRKPRSHQRRM